ncbi:MAG: type II secretion system protein [Phycisphaerae bacterium]|nr:type II secretion system protein [Phycisphaerae bacterium]
MMRTRGFTLRDLVVVLAIVFILAMLVALMIPARSIAPPELIKQAECRANLSYIGRAFAMYKHEEDGGFPLIWSTGQPEADIATSDSAGTIEELRMELAGREAAMQNVWLLIDKGFVGEETFQCPSDEDYRPRRFSDPAYRIANRVGWWSSANFSYGLHFPYESTMVGGRAIENPAHLNAQLRGSFVIMADKNPSQNNEPATGVGSNRSPSNHEDGEMYLTFSGAAGWTESTEHSDVNGDNIYTIETDFPEGKSNKNSETPANLDDQYIVRHPALPKEK